MPTLLDLTQQKRALEQSRENVIKAHIDQLQAIDKELQTLSDAIGLHKGGLDLEKIATALEILEIRGNAAKYQNAPAFKRLVASAIGILSNPAQEFFSREHLWIKEYASFGPQGGTSEYGLGPRHGRIVFSIGFNRDWRGQELGNTGREACLYYLYNLIQIAEATGDKNAN